MTILIDNKSYTVKAGKNLLEACLTLGLDLPYFCWHPAMGSVGACRQCAVKVFKDENDTKGRLVMSCMETVTEGLRLSIEDKTAKAFREQVIEWLMTNHPHDCPVCDEGGACHLQDMTVMTGHDYRRYNFKKRTYTNQYLGPLINHEMNRCIQCYRCVRYYRDYAGGDDLNVFAAHNHVYFGREKDGVLQSPFSGNLSEVCPTGVFTDKTLKEHYTRKWDLTMAPSVCNHCSVGCNTIAAERYGELRCMLNRYNGDVNGYFLCDRGRFGYEFVNSENRIKQALIRNRTNEAATEDEIMEHLQPLISVNKLVGIGSPRASLESNFALMQLVGKENFYQGISEDEAHLNRLVVEMLFSGCVHSASLKDIEQADAVLVMGEDIWNTAPMLALAVRQAVVKTAASQASQEIKIPVWLDSAIKELTQEEKGFLATLTVTTSPVDDIATHSWHAAPDDLARLGFAIASYLQPGKINNTNFSEELLNRAKTIGDALKKAKNPVVITGISCYNDNVIKAAFDVAVALSTSDRKTGFCCVMTECNSMGLAMMEAPSFSVANENIKTNGHATAVILENDIYKHVTSNLADEFFNSCDHVIALDALHNATTEKAQVLLPAATFADGDGTLVNNEGRAQRFFQVIPNTTSQVQESWRWLRKLQSLKLHTLNGHALHPDDLLREMEIALPQFKDIASVSLKHDFTIHGEKIPRAPHRYSGRTAILANKNVSEPKPFNDEDSPLSFTMEGYKGTPPSGVVPFFWSPGWNSVQSVNKYQDETNGALRGGNPGLLLFKEKIDNKDLFFNDVPESFVAAKDRWLLLPKLDALGSGELSSYSAALKTLSPQPFAIMSPGSLLALEAKEGDMLQIMDAGIVYGSLPVKADENLCDGVVLVTAGLRESIGMSWGARVQIGK
ncbi:NADH-quinone oxidoreductase subunit NuoG [Pinibacter aurantiacus]|uniref:NADH-quinone oxidoreductase n=1 Tax=Pinibacter aurantiacus TaxID=2851599 RepID=A0A9E2W959_9BACT|nr:NADH-quinone oxidoreductase subunit NuoG [Pinibacter aurantiacus]MBV4359207.1 NADH-quinone oxidoreductase subunit NuoG [Pinibacter aurantiacus]